MHTRPDVWFKRLLQAAEPALTTLRTTSEASAEFGSTRAIDHFLLARFRGVAAADAPSTATSKPSSADLEFWSHLARGETIPIDSIREWGPLIPPQVDDAIEIWTETELSSLHAAWWFGLGSSRWSKRVLEAARWHVEHTQPDNATGLPWAIHVMVDLACSEVDPEAELLAQTLLHNCLVERGLPCRRAALILHDAARALEAKYTSR